MRRQGVVGGEVLARFGFDLVREENISHNDLARRHRLRAIANVERIAILRYDLVMHALIELSWKVQCLKDADLVEEQIARVFALVQNITPSTIERCENEYIDSLFKSRTAVSRRS